MNQSFIAFSLWGCAASQTEVVVDLDRPSGASHWVIHSLDPNKFLPPIPAGLVQRFPCTAGKLEELLAAERDDMLLERMLPGGAFLACQDVLDPEDPDPWVGILRIERARRGLPANVGLAEELRARFETTSFEPVFALYAYGADEPRDVRRALDLMAASRPSEIRAMAADLQPIDYQTPLSPKDMEVIAAVYDDQFVRVDRWQLAITTLWRAARTGGDPRPWAERLRAEYLADQARGRAPDYLPAMIAASSVDGLGTAEEQVGGAVLRCAAAKEGAGPMFATGLATRGGTIVWTSFVPADASPLSACLRRESAQIRFEQATEVRLTVNGTVSARTSP